MRSAAIVVCMLTFAAACGEKTPPKPVDVAGQKVYALKGTIVSRDRNDNTVRLDHEAVPGLMEGMTMDYSLRGGAVEALPPNGSHVVARLHAANEAYWISDVKKVP